MWTNSDIVIAFALGFISGIIALAFFLSATSSVGSRGKRNDPDKYDPADWWKTGQDPYGGSN